MGKELCIKLSQSVLWEDLQIIPLAWEDASCVFPEAFAYFSLFKVHPCKRQDLLLFYWLATILLCAHAPFSPTVYI